MQLKKDSTNISTPLVNTERQNENKPMETTDITHESGKTSFTTEPIVNTLNTALENRITDEIDKPQDPTQKIVTTENSADVELLSKKTVNTENTDTEINQEGNSENNEPLNLPDKSTSEEEPTNVNTENTPQHHATLTSSTPKNSIQAGIKEDWSSLMFSSDDSLFEEMTKQLETDNNNNNNGVKRKSPTSTVSKASTSMHNQDTLSDIVYSGKKSDAVTGLLMLGADLEQLDAEIDNKIVMPVNKPKQPDGSKPTTNNENKENKKRKPKKKSRDRTESGRRSTRQNDKSTKITSTITVFLSSPKSPGSPRGVLKVTRYKL